MTANKGLYVEPVHAAMVHNGSKTIIIKDKYFAFLPDEMSLVTTKDKTDMALGMIRLAKPKRITIREFKSMRKFHKISDETRRKLWPNAQKLFAYNIKQYYGYKNFKELDMIVHNDIVTNFSIKQDDKFNLQIAEFSARSLTDSQLKDNFRKICQWHTGAKSKFSKDDIILLGRKLMYELRARNIKFRKSPATMKIIKAFTTEQITEPVKSFSAEGENYSTALEYDLSDIKAMAGFRQIEHAETSEGIIGNEAESIHYYDMYYANGEYWMADDGIIKWRSMKDRPHEAVEEWHRVTGQRLQLEDCAQPDGDYLVTDPDKKYDNAAAYVLSDPKGKSAWLEEGTHIPVFIPESKLKEVDDWQLEDIRTLKKGKPYEFKGYSILWDGDNIDISESKTSNFSAKSTIELDFIKPTKPYLDMDAHVSNEFFMLEDMKDFDYTNKTIEKKYDGQRLQAHKNGNSVKFYTAYGNQIPLNRLGNIPNEVRAINSHAFVLDGELILPDSDRNVVHDAVTTTGSDMFQYMVFDILQVNDSRLLESPLSMRRQILERLSSSPHVKVSPARKVTKDNIRGFLKQLKEQGYEGAVIKDLNSKYQDRHAWHKFVFISNYLIKTEDMAGMAEHELKDYKITLRRMDRKLKEGKRIPFSDSILNEQKDMISKLTAKAFSAPKFTLTRKFCWWLNPKKKKRKRNNEEYNLKLAGYNFHLNKDPRNSNSITAESFAQEGKYFQPGEFGDDAQIENICIGEFELIQEEPNMIEVKFKGKKLSGKFIFKRKTGNAWSMTKVTKEKKLSAVKMDFKDFRKSATPILAKDITFPYMRRTIAFAPGVWHHTVYEWDIIKDSAMKLKGVPVVIEHSDEILDDVGNVTEVFINEQEQRIEVDFELLDTENGKDAAILLENGKIPAVSVSLEEWSDDIDGKNVCTQIVGFGHMALVKNPECAPAKICDKNGTCG